MRDLKKTTSYTVKLSNADIAAIRDLLGLPSNAKRILLSADHPNLSGLSHQYIRLSDQDEYIYTVDYAVEETTTQPKPSKDCRFS